MAKGGNRRVDVCGVCKEYIREEEVEIKLLNGKSYHFHKGKCSEILGYRFSRLMEILELPDEEFLAWLATEGERFDNSTDVR